LIAEGIYNKIRFTIGKFIDDGTHLNAAKTAEVIGKKLGLSKSLIEFTHIELRNSVYESSFKQIPFKDRALFLPHCVRNLRKCKSIQDEEGIHCKKCGSCGLKEAIEIAENLGYGKIFIIPGGSMMKSLIEKYKCKAVVGVSCFYEAILGFESLKNSNIIPQAVLLLNDGCKDTVINLPLLEEKLKAIESV
jgi:hypothetical protein